MNPIQIPKFLAIAVLLAAASISGCATGTGGLASSPVYPASDLDYSSHLERLQARGERSSGVQTVGYQAPSAYSPTFSRGSGSRSGSC